MLDIIKKAVSGMIKMQVVVCEVLSVNTANQTCELRPVNGDADMQGVRLKAVIDQQETGIIVFPKSGSTVLAGLIENQDTNAFVVAQSEFDSCLIAIQGALKITIDGSGNIVINDGQNDGMVKLPALKTEIDKINSFLTAIKNTFSSWTPVANDGGAALKAAMSDALASQQTANLSNVGNEKIKH